MPTILALETSTDTCSAALQLPTEIIHLHNTSPREHTQRLLPMVSQLLSQAGISLKQVDGIAFSQGPGSFTGLRICLSTAQGLAYSADLPLIPISTLKAMAHGLLRQEDVAKGSYIVPAIDARMNEIYWAEYGVNDNGIYPLSDEIVGKPEHCYETITQAEYDPLLAIGSGWHYPIFESVKADMTFAPSAYDVSILGAQAYQEDKVVSALDAKPRYLRDEINWEKRKRIRT